ncbi:hypothetical protein [Nannocystis sp. SCPEA4]|uniref:hypothetical protein n=1 Tax=Nannocystis sp. SCPEA4 TaxID=2996787 RepID=UPI00226E0465|nr:hypothetical protein [Nannocystis sp. SCPEA4]
MLDPDFEDARAAWRVGDHTRALASLDGQLAKDGGDIALWSTRGLWLDEPSVVSRVVSSGLVPNRRLRRRSTCPYGHDRWDSPVRPDPGDCTLIEGWKRMWLSFCRT